MAATQPVIEVDLGGRPEGGVRVLLMDSITQLGAAHADAVVVSGSHGGVSAASYAVGHRLGLVVFNDAGVGKDGAGIAALSILQASGTAAATVAHGSARIGDAADTWACGVVSHVNEAARAWGLAPGQALREAVLRKLGRHTAAGLRPRP